MEERWKNFFEEKHEIDYPKLTMYQLLRKTASKYPDDPAYEFMGKKTTYREFMAKIETTAKALTSIGIRAGDAVTICMPNCPQAIDTFYALNRIGAISNVIHPLSAQSEITFYLDESQSKAILTLDQFYETVVAARKECNHDVVIIMASIADELPLHLALAFRLQNFGKYSGLPNASYSITWNDFISYGRKFPLSLRKSQFEIDRPAVILYSGGTTGATKGILLSDLNFNACALQSGVAMGVEYEKGQKILSVMPIFHGFGLAIGIHTCLIKGITCDLVPRFTVKTYAEMIKKKKPAFIAGVPTLFEAMLRAEELADADLSCLKGIYCGGDALSIELKKKVDAFLKEHGATIEVKEGYGATESVNAVCLTPNNGYRPGSIGIPYPDTTIIICEPSTTKEVKTGEDGEICIAGPSVMLGYLNNEEETAQTLLKHGDGRIYLHTGDLGCKDADGYIYFKQRIKRMIITSGYNVYPSQIENIIDSHPKIQQSCVVGVKDPYKIQKIKAFVVLKPNVYADESIKKELKDYLRLHVARYALPYDIEIRKELPKTAVGKVAYRVLEDEENAKEDARAAMQAAEGGNTTAKKPAARKKVNHRTYSSQHRKK